MSKRTDEELINIVFFDRDGYQPKGVEAAEEEIKIRNISEERIEEIKADLLQKIAAQKEFGRNKVSLATRFIHSVVDKMIYYFIIGILLYIISSINVQFLLITDENVLTILFLLVMAVVYIGYYYFMETTYQKTIGKFITKTHVVKLDGTKPSNGEILNRTLCRLIPFDNLSFFFASSGFHDKFSNTTVINDASNDIKQ
jgi:uncharacterized RDD family membrane protein YckC